MTAPVTCDSKYLERWMLFVTDGNLLPRIGEGKQRLADQGGSDGYRADRMEPFTCGYLAWVLIVAGPGAKRSRASVAAGTERNRAMRI